MLRKSIVALFCLLMVSGVWAQKKQAAQPQVEIETIFGKIRIVLYNETPLHRDNFLKLVEAKFYDSLLFHRVLKDFMVQGGDPSSKGAAPGAMLGMGGNGYTVPAEFRRTGIHKRGALAAARLNESVNPRKESSGCQFYIVQGTPVAAQNLDMYETRRIENRQNELIGALLQQPENVRLQQDLEKARMENRQTGFDSAVAIIKQRLAADFKNLDSLRYSDEQRKTYIAAGGAPHLDFDYTVFGEVTKGMDVVDKIASQAVDRSGRPSTDIIMKITVIK